MKDSIPCFTLVLILLLALTSRAQTPPPLLNYQGQLQNPDGSVLATADYTLTFSIYDQPNSGSGTLIWGPQVFDGATGTAGHGARVPVVQGYFNVLLGPLDTTNRSLATAFDGTDRYIEIKIAARAPVSPRQRLVSAPFAFRAAKADNADNLAGFNWSSVFNNPNPTLGTLLTTRIAPDSIGSDKLANNSVGTAELQNNAVTTAKIPDSAVTTSKIANGNVTGTQIANATVGVTHLESAVSQSLAPAGAIVAFGGSVPPAGWLICDGRSFTRLTFPALFNAIGTSWGAPSATTFRIPDLRGMFLRGVNGTRIDVFEDPDRQSRTAASAGGNIGNQVGSVQSDELGAHTHTYNDSNPDANSGASVDDFIDGTDVLHQEDRQRTTASAGGLETRPKNAYVHYIIKI